VEHDEVGFGAAYGGVHIGRGAVRDEDTPLAVVVVAALTSGVAESRG